jgi:hypothetical protein
MSAASSKKFWSESIASFLRSRDQHKYRFADAVMWWVQIAAVRSGPVEGVFKTSTGDLVVLWKCPQALQ